MLIYWLEKLVPMIKLGTWRTGLYSLLIESCILNQKIASQLMCYSLTGFVYAPVTKGQLKGENSLVNCVLTYLLISLLTYLLHGAESFLRGNRFQLVKNFPLFHATRMFITAFANARRLSLSWTSSIQSIPPTSHFLKIHLNIILPSTPGSPKWSLFLSFPHQNPVYASPLTHTPYMSCPFNSSQFYHPNNIVWNVEISKFLIMYFSPLSC